MNYRKKPIVIQAVKCSDALSAAQYAWQTLPDFLKEAYDRGDIVFAHDHMAIKTLEGTMIAQLRDWIIRGVKGEIYPCKPDIFYATYEAVE